MRGVSTRAVLLGLLIIPLNNYWVFYSEIVLLSGHPSTTSLFFNSVFVLLLLSGANAVLRKRMPTWAFSQGELLTVYLMVNIATALGSHDMIQVLVPEMAYPHFYATPENQWDRLFMAHLPSWLTISDPTALNGFFKGNSSLYEPVVLRAWLVPVLMWSGFIVALLFVMLCLSSILRKQWMEHEKLSYPLVQLPLEISSAKVPLLRSRLFFLGVGIAAAIDLVQGLHTFVPSIPLLPLKTIDLATYMTARPWSAVGWMPARLYPFGVGLAFLLPLDLSFSAWFFFLFWKAELVLSSALGLDSIPRFPYVNEQSFGAYMGIAAFALWTSRRPLSRIVRNAIRGTDAQEDNAEAMRYRTAVLGVIIGTILLSRFAHAVGLSLWLLLPFFAIYFVLSVSITRLRAELGPPAHDLHIAGPDAMLPALLGPQSLGAGSLVALSMMYWFNRAYRAHPMPFMLEGLKAAEASKTSYRAVAVAIMSAAVVGTLASFWIQLHVYYKLGAAAKTSWVPLVFASEPYARLDGWIRGPAPPSSNVFWAVTGGCGLTLLLNSLRMRLGWFPFHPVGFAISSSWSLHMLWLSMFVAWLIKLLVLRCGTLRLYRSAMPFFLGIVVGECVMASIWTLVGMSLNIATYAVWP